MPEQPGSLFSWTHMSNMSDYLARHYAFTKKYFLEIVSFALLHDFITESPVLLFLSPLESPSLSLYVLSDFRRTKKYFLYLFLCAKTSAEAQEAPAVQGFDPTATDNARVFIAGILLQGRLVWLENSDKWVQKDDASKTGRYHYTIICRVFKGSLCMLNSTSNVK